MAELADVLDQGVDGIFLKSMPPGRHARSSAYREPAKLNGLKKLFIGAGFKIGGFGVVPRWNREEFGVYAVALSFYAMALGAIPFIGLPGFFRNRYYFRLWSLSVDFSDFPDFLLCGRFGNRCGLLTLSASSDQNCQECYSGE